MLELMTKPSQLSPAEGALGEERTIDEQLARLDARLQSFDEQQAEWDARQAELRLVCEAREKELADIKAELEASRARFDAERRDWETARNQQQSAWEVQRASVQYGLDDRVAGLDALQVDLHSQRAAWEKERRLWEAQCKETEAARLTEIEARQAELDRRQAEIELRERQLEESCGSGKTEEATATASTGDETSPPADADTAAKLPAAPTTAAPVDLAEVLRRTGFQVDQADEESPSSERADSDTAAGESTEAAPVNITAPVPRTRTPAQRGEDEVSIDDYMVRLLARNRGDAAPAASGARPATAARPSATVTRTPVAVKTPAAAPTPAAPKPDMVTAASSPTPPAKPGKPANAPKQGESGKLAPHTVAPEKRIDFRAMRQLANLSADTALNKHEAKRLAGTTRAKLLVTVVAGVCGAILWGLHTAAGAHTVSVALAIASFGIAALWGTNYLALTTRILGVRRAHMERHLKVGEESPIATDETPAVESPLTVAEG